MKNAVRKNFVPDGMRDLVYDEAALLNDTARLFEEVYKKHSFKPVITPGIEYLEVMDQGAIPSDMMYKLTDTSGRLIALRADNTTPIARIAASKLIKNGKSGTEKIYYSQSVYRCGGNYAGRRNEITQSGIELIGASGLKADICAVSIALEALEATGLNYKLEIGHVGLFNALIEDSDLENDEKDEIRKYVESKNSVSLSFMREKASKDDATFETRKAFYDKMRRLPLLFGTDEVFEKARDVAGENEKALEAVDYVRKLYDILKASGYSEKIMVDFGIVHEMDYYTGIVFRGYVDGSGESVLGGGRYDGFISNFGKDIPATGFAVNVSAVADALSKKSRQVTSDGENTILVHFDPNDFPRAKKFRADMLACGKKCEYSQEDDIIGSIEYASAEKIKTVAIISRDTVELKELY